ncbi:MAG: heavy metal sensor histidine kinase [Gammaproteobacteria bacterium]|nr:heavy metal sensor histidine kinase [Gammaproteobacteria bacterium]
MSSKFETDVATYYSDFGFKKGSIATRLAFWFTLLSVILIVSVSAVLYVALEERLREKDDHLIKSMFNEFRNNLNEYPYNSQVVQNELKHEVESFAGLHIALMDLDGKVVVEAPAGSFNNRLIYGLHDSVQKDLGKDWTANEGDKYRIMQQRIFTPNGDFILSVGINRSEEESLIASTFWRTLVLATLCALLVSIILGRRIAKRSTQPLAKLATVVSEISAKDLHRRVSNETWPEELKPLAENFDQLLSRLESSFGRIEQFSADIAHEFRTPLHILCGEAEMALTTAQTQEEYRACIESATEEYHRLSQMVESLLFMARAEQPDAMLNRKPLDIAHEIEAVCDFYQAMADEKKITLEFGGEGSVFAESNLLRRALSNLITNALRYTPSGGRVVVEGKERMDHEVDVTVMDTGMGIAADQLPQVFDRFYRGDKARSRKGTGLGLAIVKSIMTLHGGTVSIHSEPGRGTSVTLKFPALAVLMYSGPRRRKDDHKIQFEQVA